MPYVLFSNIDHTDVQDGDEADEFSKVFCLQKVSMAR